MPQSDNYADLEIRIGEQKDQGYPVELILNSEQEFDGGYLADRFIPWVPGASPSEDGKRLFDWLFADEAFKLAWAEIRGQSAQRRLRLNLATQEPELHAIPWELLHDSQVTQDLAATSATPFSRYLAGRWLPGSPILKRPIKMLLAVANPSNLAEYDLAAIDVDGEWESLQQALNNVDEVEVTLLDELCTLSALEQALRDGYHILHIVAHGQYSRRREQTVLYFVDNDDDEKVALVTGDELAAMLTRQLADVNIAKEDKLRLVFLASCQTATNDPRDAFRAVAPALVAAGVPAVLATQGLITVETAQAFSQTFYDRLMEHGRVDLACNEARAGLMTAKLPGAALPVLYMRQREGRLLDRPGRISSKNSTDDFWPYLLDYIDRGQCIPFLGPGANNGLLPSRAEIARKLADRYGYMLSDRESLTRVTQYIALRDPGQLRQTYVRILQASLFPFLDLKLTPAYRDQFKGATLSELISGLDWAERILTRLENPVHHLLADMNFPLFLTTNVDSFMEEALKAKGRTPRSVGLRWKKPEAGSPAYIISPDPDPQSPVVLHLNGFDEPEQVDRMVLSEDDYLAHFVRLSRDWDYVLPMNVIESLTRHSYLFLGYSLQDWEFRVILQGLLNSISQQQKVNVGVQLHQDEDLNAEQVVDFFSTYLSRFNIDIYWGTPQQFVSELHSHWMARGGNADGDTATLEADELFDPDIF